MKALVKERISDWKKKFGKILGKKVEELTGDVTPDLTALQNSDIILTTPEKWDGVSRGWKQRKYVRKVALVVIDEIHMLGQDRGPILEVIASRMRYISAKLGTNCRIVGLSTSLANPSDLADWMGIDRVGLYNFTPSIRPIPLEIHIAGFPGNAYCPRMATMNKPTFQAIIEHSYDKPVLIFVSSRRQTRLTSMELINLSANSDHSPVFNRMDELDSIECDKISDETLRHTIKFGIGIHHAGLATADRKIVEKLFRNQKIQVLVTTSTLAWGVNLPAHLVVIKGTEFYDAKEKRYVDMPTTDVMQMMGRAGRPQYDDRGIAVILVHEPRKHFYRKFLFEPFPVESSLANCLHDHFNAEIVNGMITCKQDCVDYLTWTYFYRRVVRNPTYYGLTNLKGNTIDFFLSEKVEKTLKDLETAKCITIENEKVQATTLGIIGSFYYLSFESVFLFSEQIKEDSSVEDLLNTLCSTAEYDELPVRHNEELLNEDLAGEVRLEVDEFTYDDPHTKAQLLLQAHFSHLPLPVVDYKTDTLSVLDKAIRILQAMIDVSTDLGYLETTKNCITLLQMMVQACWWDDSPLNTLPTTNKSLIKKMQALNLTMKEVCSLPKQVSDLVSQNLSKGEYTEFVETISFFPRSKLAVTSPAKVTPGQQIKLQVDIQRLSKYRNKIHAPRFPKQITENWYLLLADTEVNEVLSLKRVNFKTKTVAELEFLAPEDTGEFTFSVLLLCGSYVGLDQETTFTINVEEN